MAEHGFYRSSGAAWQRALPPELCRPDDGEVLRRGWDLLALDGSVIEPQDIPLPEAWGCWETEPLLLLAGVYLLLGRL